MLRLRRKSHLLDCSPELSPHGVKANVKGSIDFLGLGLPMASSLQASHLCSAIHQQTAQKSEQSSGCFKHLLLRTGQASRTHHVALTLAALEIQEMQVKSQF